MGQAQAESGPKACLSYAEARANQRNDLERVGQGTGAISAELPGWRIRKVEQSSTRKAKVASSQASWTRRKKAGYGWPSVSLRIPE